MSASRLGPWGFGSSAGAAGPGSDALLGVAGLAGAGVGLAGAGFA